MIIHIDAGLNSASEQMTVCGLMISRKSKDRVTRVFSQVTCKRCKDIDEGKS